MIPSGSLLVAGDLRKSFGATTALDGASFSIHAGEVVAGAGAIALRMVFARVHDEFPPVLWRRMRPEGLRTE
ncbi:hypothetical protein CGZ69_22735 [Streptomyces peucetius subsp. caesius ATCC 27952]|nr:hypothetical protein CGZ69_22735 [Streptomyces peucetius subsp. caesius ATCC 27952]